MISEGWKTYWDSVLLCRGENLRHALLQTHPPRTISTIWPFRKGLSVIWTHNTSVDPYGFRTCGRAIERDWLVTATVVFTPYGTKYQPAVGRSNGPCLCAAFDIGTTSVWGKCSVITAYCGAERRRTPQIRYEKCSKPSHLLAGTGSQRGAATGGGGQYHRRARRARKRIGYQ
jgi:hypothetical protein